MVNIGHRFASFAPCRLCVVLVLCLVLVLLLCLTLVLCLVLVLCLCLVLLLCLSLALLLCLVLVLLLCLNLVVVMHAVMSVTLDTSQLAHALTHTMLLDYHTWELLLISHIHTGFQRNVSVGHK